MKMRPIFLILAVCLVFAGCETLDDSTTKGNAPTILFLDPAQVELGASNVKVIIHGTNFVGLMTVDFGPGIQMQNTQVNSTVEISVILSVNSDAASGARTVKVSNQNGTATSTAFSVESNRLPVARFKVTPAKGNKETIFTFDASDSTDPDGTIQSYDWDFGDGTSANGKVVTHQFKDAGTMKVRLEVTDNKQGKSSIEKEVSLASNIHPTAQFSVTPTEGDSTVRFEFDARASSDPDGRIVLYQWDFDDGDTQRGERVEHRFNRKGTYKVKLTVEDNGGLVSSAIREVRDLGLKPKARLALSPQEGNLNTTFLFDGSGSDDPDGAFLEYEWRFGDGSQQKGDKKTEYQYDSGGAYTVELKVTDKDGLEDIATRQIRVQHEGGGVKEGKCTEPAKLRIAYLFKVLEANQSTKTIVGQFFEDVTCKDVFYLCGDVRLGAYNGAPGKEYWIGTICAMESLGDNTFKIRLVEGRSWVDVGETGTYVWPQLDCDPKVHCKAFGY